MFVVSKRVTTLSLLLAGACVLTSWTGVVMKMYNEDNTALVDETVYGDIICDNCDTPGVLWA